MIGDRMGLIAVYSVLVLFGVGYNLLVAWVEERGYIRGYVALFVAGGVLITLVGVALITPIGALITLGAFVASGTPMILGSIWRYIKDRERELDSLRNEAKDGDAS